MASEWYYRLGDREMGPIAYRELIQLVRDGTVREEDLVRGEWPSDWQRADSVVGLFHMAHRQEVPAVREQEAVSEVTASEDVPPIVTPPVSSRIGLSRLLPALFRRSIAPPPPSSATAHDYHQSQQQGSKAASVTPESPTAPTPLGVVVNQVNQSEESHGKGTSSKGPGCEGQSAEVSSAPVANEWTSTVAEALQAAEARDAALVRDQKKEEVRDRARGMIHALLAWPVRLVTRLAMFLFGWLIGAGGTKGRDRVAGGLAVLERWLPRPSVLRIGFKVAAAILAANLAAFGILKWSDRQALRFPGAESETGQAFPVIGECGPMEFTLLVFQAALIAGVAAYGLAAVLEANADD